MIYPCLQTGVGRRDHVHQNRHVEGFVHAEGFSGRSCPFCQGFQGLVVDPDQGQVRSRSVEDCGCDDPPFHPHVGCLVPVLVRRESLLADHLVPGS